MSYILDALRKADAERRGAPSQLSGQAEPALLVEQDADADLPPSRARPWLWVAGGMVLALAAVGGWSLWRGMPAAPPPVAVATPPVAEPVPAPPAAEPSPPTDTGPSADALPNFPPPLPEVRKPEPARPEPARPEPRATSAETGGARAPLPPGIAVVPPAAAGGNRVHAVNELPEDVRRDLPRLNVGGAMYSERAADRMVVLNGQVFKEGDDLGKGLTLRQIRLKSAVFEFRGYRVEIGY